MHSLLFGSIISATDPVAVVALLKELGASKRLSTLIEGESLLNDGTAMVVFAVILEMCHGTKMSSFDIVAMFCRLSVGGPLLGLFAGIICTYILSKTFNNAVLEVNTTIFMSYITFYVAENTPLHVSGILALVSLGLYMTKSGKTMISAESEHAVHHVWGYVGFMAETVIFTLSGIIMGHRLISYDSELSGVDIGLTFASYIILHFIRFACISMFWPFLKLLGYGMSFK